VRLDGDEMTADPDDGDAGQYSGTYMNGAARRGGARTGGRSPAWRPPTGFSTRSYAVRLIADSSSASLISTESTIAMKSSSSYLSEAQKKFK
jgi:hypothetical protein